MSDISSPESLSAKDIAQNGVLPDRAITVMTNDGAFRVIVARTTESARGIIEAQKAKGKTARHLADIVSGTALIRWTMAPAFRVQGVARGAHGQGMLAADSYPDGAVRGLVRGDRVEIADGAQLQMMRSMPNGSIHQGIVEMDGEHGIAGGFMTYMLDSEQVTSVTNVGTAWSEDGKLLHAGGFVVQLLPECTEPPLAVMYERMRGDFADHAETLRKFNADPEVILSEILYDMPYTVTQEHELVYRCTCSRERVLASLATVAKNDLEEMLSKEEVLFIKCDYCNTEYEVQPEVLRGLIAAS